MYMAQRGHVVFVMDNHGTTNRGKAFEEVIHRRCGQREMADQARGIEFLRSLPWVDAGRIGLHGWSYGGFMTISLITNYPDFYRVAVAGGPVIDWKWYEVMYGERYMDTPAENPDGYAATSLLPRARELKGKLLICQGVQDPVVVPLHALSFLRACIESNVQVDYFPYPLAEHNVSGRDRVHLMQKVTDYLEAGLRP
jgi:dipeptidyl-peptidase-4